MGFNSKIENKGCKLALLNFLLSKCASDGKNFGGIKKETIERCVEKDCVYTGRISWEVV